MGDSGLPESFQIPQDNQKGQHPLANYNFSSDELRVLKECNTEAFFQRSLPLGTAMGVGAFLAIKNGYLKPSASYGVVPKVVVSVIVGYFAGKFSYQNKCAEKLMRLPNSRLAEVLKQKKKRGSLYESLSPDQGFGSGLALQPFSSGADQYSDELYKNKKQTSSLDIDTERPSELSLDENYRGNVDNTTKFEDNLPLEPSKTEITYDELRKRNRTEYQQRTLSPLPNRAAQEEQPIIIRELERDSPSQSNKKNKYGDNWNQ